MHEVNTLPVDNLVENIFRFNQIAGKSEPGVHFDAERVGFYGGMVLEETAEFLRAVAVGIVHPAEREQLEQFCVMLDVWGMEFKQGKYQGAIVRSNREELADASIDVAYVSLGALIYQTPHFRHMLAAVMTANAEKFPNGVALRDPNGKVIKPTGWTPPNLLPFIDHHGE